MLEPVVSTPKTDEGSEIDFGLAFEALTGHTLLRWQTRLFNLMLSGKTPRVCDLPTGLGKTSVIAIWLIALCQEALEGRITLPRRLVYIVNRRTVVDQATTTVKQIRERLLSPNDPDCSEHVETLRGLEAALRLLSPKESPFLAVSTLRGELADNEEWKDDPARAAIIVGTIDMIGSKLLFSGYGDSLRSSPRHAGLIGHDSLVIHDEAHLTPAFSDLLRDIRKCQVSDREFRPIQIMELSATQRQDAADGDVFPLEVEDRGGDIVAERLDAKKLMRLHEASDGDRALTAKLSDLALKHEQSSCKVIIYVRTPKVAQDVMEELQKQLDKDSDNLIAMLTGTIRGHERDRLVSENPVYRAMLDSEVDADATVYLVSTSAGEVGIDIDADHMVCDLTALDSMIQRLGRVNRRGGIDREANVDVVWQPSQAKPRRPSGFALALAATIKHLRSWSEHPGGSVDVSPGSLRSLLKSLSMDNREAAFTPKPPIVPVDDVLFDDWSMTSVSNVPGRPDVSVYLHGRMDDPPETYVAWRKEVSLFGGYSLDSDAASRLARDWFRICRIRSNERVSGRTDQVWRFLGNLLRSRKRQNESADYCVVLLNRRLNAERVFLSELLEKRDRQWLNYKTVVLPDEAGGLDQYGMLDYNSRETDLDVADSFKQGLERQRVLPGYTADPRMDNWEERRKVTLKPSDDDSNPDDTEAAELILLMPNLRIATDEPEFSRIHQTLCEHTERIMSHMKDIGDRIGLESQVASALVAAAKWHDKGKDRRIWQSYARNECDNETLAKSSRYRSPHVLAGYRHEFGSLLDAMKDHDILAHSESDLILHLIASHHGRARPSFEPAAFDRTRVGNESANFETMRRFGRLQERFGRWSLAWLEACLHSADVAASRSGESIETNQPCLL